MEEESVGSGSDPPQPPHPPEVTEVKDKPERIVSLGDIGSHVTCGLCRGYLIDAQTVTDCVHSCEWFNLH